MEILRFLKIIERIIIFIVIAGFIPLAVYVFTAHSLNVPQETQLAYSQLSNQINTGFVLGVRKNCTPQQAASFNFYCFQHCIIDSTCSIINSTRNCQIGSQQLTNFGKKYCASSPLTNQVSNSQPYISLSLNQTNPPLFSLQNQLQPTYYVYNGDLSKTLGGETCKDIVKRMGYEIMNSIKSESQGWVRCLVILFYTLIPIYAFTILSTLIQTFTRYDCKRLMQISLFNASIISLGIVITGIVYQVRCGQFEDTIKWLGNNCLISSTYSDQMRNNLTVDITNGLDTGFTIAIGIIGVLQIFLVISLVIVWLIEIRMSKLKKEDISSGYQLYTL